MSDLKTSTPTSHLTSAEASLSIAGSLGQLLVMVLDINPNQTFFTKHPKALLQWLDASLALANSHIMLHPNNDVAFVGAHASGCSFLYAGPQSGGDGGAAANASRQRDGQFEGFYAVEAAVRGKVAEILSRESATNAPINSDSRLSGALSMALAFVNRRRSESPLQEGAQARILAMSASGDTASQYMNYMNVFFSAQKMAVSIDNCMLDIDSGLLQQGADITGGIYRRVQQKHFPSLLQFLIWIFLPDKSLREGLSLPSAERVDYHAACFCHRNLIDVGFVCSVCLSIFCKYSPICTTCHTVFKNPGPLPLPKKKKVATPAKAN